MTQSAQDTRSPWRQRLAEIIFEADTPAGKTFDVILILSIILSVLAVMLESVLVLQLSYGKIFFIVEWFFTILFTIEYILRIISFERPRKYVFSFFGVIDLLAIIPTYLSIFLLGAQSLLVVRSFRLLRIFRIFKLTQYLSQANLLGRALSTSRPKITVFLVGVMATVVTVGAMMYLIEGASNGFTSIPQSVYWAIVTMTTVGYGDISPQTVIGQMLASLLMIVGYGILAVPTGIVSVEMARADRELAMQQDQARTCSRCKAKGHGAEANYCKFCGESL